MQEKYTLSRRSGSSKESSNKASPASDFKIAKTQLLCHFDDLPEWQKDNEYIHNGYVKETNSYKQILKSLSYLHNESVNIYTHLLPGIVCLLLLLGVLEHKTMPKYATTSYLDYLVVNFFFFRSSVLFFNERGIPLL